MSLERVVAMLPSTAGGAFRLGFVAALVVGLTIILVVGPLADVSEKFAGDGHDGYWQLAVNLIRGNGYVFEAGGPAAFHRPPLAPLLLSPLTLLPQPLQRPGVVVLQSLLVGLTCALAFDLARRVFHLRAARACLLLLLSYPWLYWHVKNPMNVIAQMAFTTLVLYLIGRELSIARDGDAATRQRFSPAAALALGLAAGSAILTHGTMLLSVPVLLAGAAVLGLRFGSTRTVKVSIVAGLIALFVLAPWTYRNWRVTGQFMPVVGGAGLQYFFGHVHWGFDGQDDGHHRWDRIVAASVGATRDVTHFWGFKDPALEAEANRRMAEDLRAHPARFAKRVALNAVEFYIPIVRDVLMPKTRSGLGAVARRAALSAWHLGLVALGFLAICRNRRQPAAAAGWLAVAVVAVLAGCYMPFVASIGHNQYVLQTLPVLAFCAASLFGSPVAAATSDSRPGRAVPQSTTAAVRPSSA